MFKNCWHTIKNWFIHKKRYELKEVFTPASSANIAYIERETIEKKLSKAIDIPGKQIVIYGHSGSGKTTILNHMLIEKNITKVISRCTTNSTIDSIILDAFDSLNPYYTENISNTNKNSIKGDISSEYLGIKSAISSTTETTVGKTQKRLLPPQLTIQRLSHFIGKANAIWIIEDFHKVAENEKTSISQMMKLFMDIATEYPNTKIVILGAANNGYEVVQYDTELNNRVSEIEVPLLTEKEIERILQKGTAVLNIQFSDKLIKSIANYSNCLATIAHQLAYNLCFNNNILKTQKKQKTINETELNKAVNDFSSEKQDTYKSLYLSITKQREGKYKNVEIILNTLSNIPNEEITQHELYNKILEKYQDYPQGNLSTYLKKLTSIEGEEVLRNTSNRISFSDPFFKSYVKMRNMELD